MNPIQENETERLLIDYAERFKENFPTFYVRDEDQIVIMICQCLDDGKPYKPDYSDKSLDY